MLATRHLCKPDTTLRVTTVVAVLHHPSFLTAEASTFCHVVLRCCVAHAMFLLLFLLLLLLLLLLFFVTG